MALLRVCFGLRISEALALKWQDVDWLNGRLRVERGIICQIVDDVKTPESQRSLHIADEMLDMLKHCKQASHPARDSMSSISSSEYLRRNLPWVRRPLAMAMTLSMALSASGSSVRQISATPISASSRIARW